MTRSALAAVTFVVALAAGISVFAIQDQVAGQQAATPRSRLERRARAAARVQWGRLDKDGNGSISKDEWVRDPQVFDRLDANKDGALSPEEARQVAAARVQQPRQERWNRLDKDSNGVLTKAEWPRRPEVFDRLDANKDGQLTADEIRAQFARRRKRG
jgi:Ca2+-binding EF-hand superfamily protein